MKKVLVIDQERCNGCQLCMMGCSMKKQDWVDFASARIRVAQLNNDLSLVTICNQCEEPLCLTACLMEVIQRNTKGYVVREESACIACEACAAMCSFGAIHIDRHHEVAVSCDLCSGNPVCVGFCPTGALQFKESMDESCDRRENAAKRMALAVRISGHLGP